MRIVGLAGLAVLLAVAAFPAQAVEHTLVRWKKTGQCEIVTSLPLWGNHWVVLGAYNTKIEAERALSRNRSSKACPPAKSARPGANPLDKDKGPFVYRGGRTENVQ